MDHRDRSYYPRQIRQDRDRMLLVVDIDYVPLNEDDCVNDPSGEYPAKCEVCPDCEGKGKYVNPGIDSHGLTTEDFAEDPDLLRDYCSGMYDVTCRSCGGKRVILVPTTEEGKKVVQEMIDEDRAYLAEVAAERQACGYY